MNTKQIDYALELAQVKNFNRAAENLFIFQPSLSYQIQALENEIGLALFLRSGRGAEVTPAGEQFFQTLRNIREELKAAIEQGQNFSARYRSAVMIALPMRSCLYYLPEAMKAFEKTHPDVTVMPHFFPFSDFSSFLKGEEDLIFAMAIMTFMGKGVLNLFIALGLLTWVRTARMIRGSVMQLKEKEYVEAARACGASTYWIIMKELVPNCLSTIIVLVTLGIPNAIMYEASLSFLGIGIQPPTPSWGNMISAAQTFISYRPVYSIMPGVAIMITVIAFNIFGDGLRDALDPKLRS